MLDSPWSPTGLYPAKNCPGPLMTAAVMDFIPLYRRIARKVAALPATKSHWRFP